MTIAEMAVEILIKYEVSDVFGIPGGVILPFLFALEKRSPKLTPHLNYHEQMAGFAACGYAQAKGKLGVAYATRGPGITNMITCIAEAYKESLPVLFVTAHDDRGQSEGKLRSSQELELASGVSGFTKYSRNIETLQDFEQYFKKACEIALEGRRGPVFLDFYAPLFNEEMSCVPEDYKINQETISPDQSELALKEIERALMRANRPVLLIGDGLRHTGAEFNIAEDLESFGIPILSSRSAQDILSLSKQYFGYIGSHGVRYGNFILSKADLLIVVGNSLAFPADSKSFSPIVNRMRVIRLDNDESVFQQRVPHAKNFKVDVCQFLELIHSTGFRRKEYTDWNSICAKIKSMLDEYDISEPVRWLTDILERQFTDCLYVCDVGNNEFWFARAYEKVRPGGGILCSKYFGTLGSALGRAIGAYYATKKKIICVSGDQGFQYNLQELQYIAYWNLPIRIVLLNNASAGMIVEHERKLFGDKMIHTTLDSGYSIPDFGRVAEAYGIPYITDTKCINQYETSLCEIVFDEKISLSPSLPAGNVCEDMYPLMERQLFHYINNL